MITTNTTVKTHSTGLYLFMARVYGWMTAALLLTGIVATVVYSVPAFSSLIMENEMIFYGLSGGEILAVLFITSLAKKMPAWLAGFILLIYSILNGVVFASVFLLFTGTSIAGTFMVTAGSFLIMSLYGFFTKKDLTKLGNILIMGVIGLVLASVVNAFTRNDLLDWIISYAGVLVFIGLTAYNTKEVKDMYEANAEEGENKKESITGALILYLDFINLFLMLMRIFGIKKDTISLPF